MICVGKLQNALWMIKVNKINIQILIFILGPSFKCIEYNVKNDLNTHNYGFRDCLSNGYRQNFVDFNNELRFSHHKYLVNGTLMIDLGGNT